MFLCPKVALDYWTGEIIAANARGYMQQGIKRTNVQYTSYCWLKIYCSAHILLPLLLIADVSRRFFLFFRVIVSGMFLFFPMGNMCLSGKWTYFYCLIQIDHNSDASTAAQRWKNTTTNWLIGCKILNWVIWNISLVKPPTMKNRIKNCKAHLMMSKN